MHDGEDCVSLGLSGPGAGHSDQMSLWGHLLQRGGMLHVWEEEYILIFWWPRRVDWKIASCLLMSYNFLQSNRALAEHMAAQLEMTNSSLHSS